VTGDQRSDLGSVDRLDVEQALRERVYEGTVVLDERPGRRARCADQRAYLAIDQLGGGFAHQRPS
jgi:hypothetical protein